MKKETEKRERRVNERNRDFAVDVKLLLIAIFSGFALLFSFHPIPILVFHSFQVWLWIWSFDGEVGGKGYFSQLLAVGYCLEGISWIQQDFLEKTRDRFSTLFLTYVLCISIFFFINKLHIKHSKKINKN